MEVCLSVRLLYGLFVAAPAGVTASVLGSGRKKLHCRFRCPMCTQDDVISSKKSISLLPRCLLPQHNIISSVYLFNILWRQFWLLVVLLSRTAQ